MLNPSASKSNSVQKQIKKLKINMLKRETNSIQQVLQQTQALNPYIYIYIKSSEIIKL